jgi:putative ATP-dependent endonuclease of OLD family
LFLRELHVENLRAIRRASVRFDATTALIGENGCGITSLLRALELVLGSDACLSPADVHRTEAATSVAPARIVLVFTERRPGEWSAPWHQPLQAVLPVAARRPRELVLVASFTPADAERNLGPIVQVEGQDRGRSRVVVQHVRAHCPLIRVSGGTLSGRGASFAPRPAARGSVRPSRAIATLVARIVTAADRLLAADTDDPAGWLHDGASAARELLAQRPEHVAAAGTGLHGSVLEILGGPGHGTPVTERPDPDGGEAEAEQLGTLLLLAAVLRQLPGGLPRGAEPLWVIEDPEAHLHPMTLAATARLLDRIRWQKIVTTHSGELLATLPLAQVRRLVRHQGAVVTTALRPRALSRESLRRVGYHLRLVRGVAMFARVWLLVEGESEFWILPQVANVLGFDLAREGICCVAFAQCGLEPLIRTAREFGIGWHLLADGDDAGQRYAAAARGFLRRGDETAHLTILRQRDIEHCFWAHGHAEAILHTAGLPPGRRVGASQAIAKAVHRRSKPFLALDLVQSVADRGPDGVPAPLASLVHTCVAMARQAPHRLVDDQSDERRARRQLPAGAPTRRRR